MRVIRLQAENIKKLTAIDITPTEDMVLITGSNASGKSSILDSIVMALKGGREIPEKPIKKGADKGKIIMDIGDFVITRSFTKDNTYLKIEKANGGNVSSPQAFLDELVGNVSFDPLEFINNYKPKEQRNILLQLIGVNVDELDKNEKELRDQRTGVGRDAKKAETLFKTLEHFPEVSETEELTISDLSDRLKEALEFNSSLQADSVANENLKEGARADIARAEEIAKQIAILTEERDALLLLLADKKKTYQETKTRLNGQVFIDTTGIDEEMKNIDTKNKMIRANVAYQKAKEEFEESKDQYESLSQQMDEIEKKRKAMLESSTMPVPGLSFDEDGPLYKDIPLAQASDGEKLMVSLGVSMALNPTLRVLRIKDGSLLDETNRQIIRDTIKEKDYQLWFESVGSDSKVGIFIEEGEIVAVDGVKTEAKKSPRKNKKVAAEGTPEEKPKEEKREEKAPVVGDEEWT